MNDIILDELGNGKYETIFYMMGSVKDGDKVYHKTSDDDGVEVAAKKVTYLETGNERYYIKYNKGQFYNPEDLNHRRKKRSDWTYLKVRPETFKFYTKFLLTRSKVHLHHAERSL